jgi:glycosyltransferase involved in cell wall biosynthesis
VSQKKKILFVGNSLSTFTGLSYVASSFLKRFYDTGNYNIAYCTISGPTSEPQNFIIFGEEFQKTFQNLKCYDSQHQDETVHKQFDIIIQQEKPDIVIAIADIWVLEDVIMSPYRNSFQLFLYATIETPFYPEYAMFPSYFDGNLRKSIKNLFNRCDWVIPVTEMGKKALENLGITKVTDNVYNGIDFDKRKIQGSDKLSAFGQAFADSFIFMCVAENSDRKILDRTLTIFKTFLDKVENKQKYKLYLHVNPYDIRGGTDLISFIVNNGLKDNVAMPQSYIDGSFVLSSSLYLKYANADCYLAFSGGEGFGLPVAESLMHKLPVVYIDYGGYAEFMSDIGYSVKPQTYINAKNIDVKWALADVDEAVRQMEFVVKNNAIVKSRSEKGYEWAKENLDWNSVIFPKMLNIIEEKNKDFNKTKLLLKQII